MAQKIFEADKNIYKMMRKIITETEEHADLIDAIDGIAIVMKEVNRPKKDPTANVMTGKTSKAPAVMEALGRADYKFVITINTVTWNEYTPEQKLAQIDHCCCSMSAKFNENTGETSYSVKKPDFIGFHGELQRHGVWREKPGGGSYPTPIEEMFGDD